MTGKGFLFLFEPQLIVFQKKSFLHSPLRALSKIVESISPYRVKVQQTKTKYTSMHNRQANFKKNYATSFCYKICKVD